MDDTTIRIEHVTKAYRLYQKPIDRLKESLMKGSCFHRDFLAVNDVSFDVKRGETVGIIGKNGAGKSTLLKMITGVLSPTSGTIQLSGTVSALLELGTGFDAERSGIENIYLNGRINGLTKKEIDETLDQILDFADIGDFINQPIKTYSSGMLVRLAFAVAVNINPEILIVDEALSVGDVRFQQKCFRKIREFKKRGTVLFVSHDTGAITSFCDRVIWLNDGAVYKQGTPSEIIDEYLTFMRYEVISDEEPSASIPDNQVTSENTYRKSFGAGDACFTRISLCDEGGRVISYVRPSQKIIIDMEIETKNRIDMPILGFNLKDPLGNELVVTNSVFENEVIPTMESSATYRYRWIFQFPDLHEGSYPIDIALASGTYDSHEQIQFISDAIIVHCIDSRPFQEGRGRIVPAGIKLMKCDT